MRAQDLVPGETRIDTIPRHRVPNATEDVVCGPVLAAVGEWLRKEEPGNVSAMRAGAEQAVDRLHSARVLDSQRRKMDERLPAIFMEFGPAADSTKFAQL